MRAKLSDDHPTTLKTMRGLAQAYQSDGQLSRAISLFETTLSKRRIKLGDAHPDTVLLTFELANAYVVSRQPEKAVPLIREFLDRTERVEGHQPPKVREVIPRARQLREALLEGSLHGQPHSREH